jgi:recombination protein RecR
MSTIPKSLTTLIDRLHRLPGIGPRSAERLTYHLLRGSSEDAAELARALLAIHQEVKICANCYNFTEEELCGVCRDASREKHQIMVVEEPLDVVAIEKTGRYRGVFHVLGGVIDPIRGIGADEIRVNELTKRIETIKNQSLPDAIEIILATNPSTEGETTAVVIRKVLRETFGDVLTITRIARGLPVGGDIDYADPVTLLRSLEGRMEY